MSLFRSSAELTQLLFFTKEDLIKFCFVMNNLYQLVVDANKILVEGGLKPPEVHLQLSPNDPEMFSICHRQIWYVSCGDVVCIRHEPKLCAHNFMNNRSLCESGMIGPSVNQE